MKRSLPLSFLSPLLFSAALFAGRAPAAINPPGIAFEDSAVVASGLTPGRPVVWFGVEHRIDAGFSGDLAQHYNAGTAAADGTARLDLSLPVAPRSFWIAVDLSSGAYAAAGPNGYALKRPARLSHLRLGAGAKTDELLDDRPFLMGLMVRPGQGAWAFTGGDGGPRDEDGVNDGHLRFALDKFDPLPGSPDAPAKLIGSDLWFIVDPLAMEIAVHKGGVAQ